MIGYVTLGSADMKKAAAFYDGLLGELGAKRFMDTDEFIAWTVGPDRPALSVVKPADGNAASVGNGTMVALAVKTPEQVQALYAKALSLGGTDEGEPGSRGGNFYAAYFRDLDGNKLNFFCMT